MTPEQIIQRVRELTRPGLVYVNLGKNDELADLAPKMADAYEYVARELAEARSERDALKAKVEQVVQRWRREASEYPASETGAAYAQAAVRLCANELAAILKGEQ